MSARADANTRATLQAMTTYGGRGRARPALTGVFGVTSLALALALSACSSGGGGAVDAGCLPVTCDQLAGQCGDLPDGCTARLQCDCPRGEVCGADGAGRCGVPRDGGARVDGGPAADGGGASDGGPDGGSGPKIGSACAVTADCGTGGLICNVGFCTRTCRDTDACNGTDALKNGPFGGIYACFTLGQGLASYCWPNGSGVACGRDGGACPLTGEVCAFARCQYPEGQTRTPRINMRCYREADCKPGESCLFYTNLDPAPDLRSEGLCLPRGTGPDARRAPGEPCDTSDDCGSGMCTPHAAGTQGTCRALCLSDSECGNGRICAALAVGERVAEYTRQYVGACDAWDGSGQTCARNADCPSGESCGLQTDFATNTANESMMRIRPRCRRTANPDGGVGGLACDRDEQCASTVCVKSGLTGRGTCSGTCFGGDAECTGGTVCRQRLVSGRDPATTADDLTAPQCTATGPGAPCSFTRGCKRCSTDTECFPTQNVTCASDGVCRDGLGRCAETCRTGCVPGTANNAGCPTGATCRTTRISGRDVGYCADSTGTCIRQTLPEDTIAYDHGRCGDPSSASPQQDLCYFHGRRVQDGGVSDVFACGTACPTGACPALELNDGGTLTTTCRPVYEFGVAIDGGFLFSARAMTPNQCAPTTAFVGRP